MQNIYPVKKGEEIELLIDKVAYGGKGIGYLNDYVIFVQDTLPGEKVLARIRKRKANFAEARLLKIITPSSLRIDAPCAYFTWCGGCTWQNINYAEQLQIKRLQVEESVKHLALIKDFKIYETLPSPKIWAYRNKMEFSFSDRRWLLPDELGNPEIKSDFALGLHLPGTFDKIIDVNNCLLQSTTANKILSYISNYCRNNKLLPYGLRTHSGFLRFLVIRESTYNEELMVNIVTSEKKPEQLTPLALALNEKYPQIKSIVNNINPKKAQIAVGTEEILLFGRDHIVEKLDKFTFKISANSFFQTNTLQAERLFNTVLEFADLHTDDVVWDLYAGTGTISLFLAAKAKHVFAFEVGEDAVADAKNNANQYGIRNIDFVKGDIAINLKSFEQRPSVIITDPPRSGMHPKVCEYIAGSGAKRVVYVSCNPTTMARDLQLICSCYQLIKIQPVDMFPHTYHIESVALLERK